MHWPETRGFWREALAIHGSITPHVLPLVIVFGVISLLVVLADKAAHEYLGIEIALEVSPYEAAGAALGLLLVLRTNAGYDRWWEARRLWGGIVNQSRNLVIGALAFGPKSDPWRSALARWVAAFAHAARRSLRGERELPEIVALIGQEDASRLAAAEHMPSHVARKLAELLSNAVAHGDLSEFAFLQVDRERATLLDHLGACERILRTPLPGVYAIKVRRFIVLFLLTFPFALLHRLDNEWLVPLVTMLVAYPLASLDQIGVELQNPFSRDNLSHLPLDEICGTIERNVLELLDTEVQRS